MNIKKMRYTAELVFVAAFAIYGYFTCVSARAADRQQNSTEKVLRINGKIVDNFSGNKCGCATIKSAKSEVDLCYYYGRFKITGAEYFKKGDLVTAFYKPVDYLDESELVSIKVIRRKKK